MAAVAPPLLAGFAGTIEIMRTAIGVTEPLELAASHALHDAIGEYDPSRDRTEPAASSRPWGWAPQ